MNIELALMGLAVYILIWEKLPDWGNWFNWIIHRLPKPLAYLYEAWHCPFCFGFWVALLLHALTGMMTISGLSAMPEGLGVIASPIGWFLDALVTALLIMIGKLLLSAIAVPAIKGHQMTQAFRKGVENADDHQ
ncbi:hypothetical protein [Flocculibacter collagenilyticus]|uniref:hypothetical protein n=1 Tax=Flocculibacter collagenilyticus TaxID=2744479 RepID=UPI0018F49F2D|nr:hypothetical protein [Flocculibacter collagenilyticus]